MKDTRIFKVLCGDDHSNATLHKRGGVKATLRKWGPQYGHPLRAADNWQVLATNAEATEGWTNVTSEFITPDGHLTK